MPSSLRATFHLPGRPRAIPCFCSPPILRDVAYAPEQCSRTVQFLRPLNYRLSSLDLQIKTEAQQREPTGQWPLNPDLNQETVLKAQQKRVRENWQLMATLNGKINIRFTASRTLTKARQ